MVLAVNHPRCVIVFLESGLAGDAALISLRDSVRKVASVRLRWQQATPHRFVVSI